VLTVGVDLAAEPVNTAVARMSWTADGAEVEELVVGADDAVLVEQIAAADKAGIDCPLGWPRRFVEFVVQHQDDAFVAPVDVAGKDWRRLLANRETGRSHVATARTRASRPLRAADHSYTAVRREDVETSLRLAV
jgi:phage terminase large subunit-like protein